MKTEVIQHDDTREFGLTIWLGTREPKAAQLRAIDIMIRVLSFEKRKLAQETRPNEQYRATEGKSVEADRRGKELPDQDEWSVPNGSSSPHSSR